MKDDITEMKSDIRKLTKAVEDPQKGKAIRCYYFVSMQVLNEVIL
jgi:hypothetical protein